MLPPIVEVAFSLVIAWALFAVLCSIVHEAVVQVKAERGRFLKKYLLQQLQDKPNGVNWATMLYMHGSIDLLSRAPGKPTSDISPRLFAETMVDVVANSMIVQKEKKTDSLQYYSRAILNDYKTATEILKESDVVTMLRQAMKHAELSVGVADGNEQMINQEVVKYLENWYAEMMERVTIWYKKATRQRLFWLGLLLAAALNINSVALYEHFDKQPKARAAMMSFYDRYVVYEPAPDDSTGKTTVVRLDFNRGRDTSAVSDSIRNADTTANGHYERQLLQAYQQLKKDATLPVGWESSRPVRELGFGDIMKLLAGLLITGFAASFGAPFWFDVLRKATRITKPLNTTSNAVR